MSVTNTLYCTLLLLNKHRSNYIKKNSCSNQFDREVFKFATVIRDERTIDDIATQSGAALKEHWREKGSQWGEGQPGSNRCFFLLSLMWVCQKWVRREEEKREVRQAEKRDETTRSWLRRVLHERERKREEERSERQKKQPVSETSRSRDRGGPAWIQGCAWIKY